MILLVLIVIGMITLSIVESSVSDKNSMDEQLEIDMSSINGSTSDTVKEECTGGANCNFVNGADGIDPEEIKAIHN